MTSHVPCAYRERGQQSAGKNSSSLQRVEAENLPPVVGVAAPIVDHVENLGSDNAGQDHEDAEVPCVVAVDTLLFRIADADPQTEQYTRGDQNTVGRQVETADVEKSRKHVILDAPGAG